MRKFVIKAVLAVIASLLAAVVVLSMAGFASAGPIEGACLNSARNGASRSLCSCIQQVADITLQTSDQSLVAAFFKDPDKAEKVRMSQSKRDDAFWDRYTTFGEQARLSCAQ